MESWTSHFKQCDLVFVRWSNQGFNAVFRHSNRNTPPILDLKDPRIRRIPFSTSRPTLKEAKRVHSLLAEVTVHGRLEEFVTDNVVEEELVEDDSDEVEECDADVSSSESEGELSESEGDNDESECSEGALEAPTVVTDKQAKNSRPNYSARISKDLLDCCERNDVTKLEAYNNLFQNFLCNEQYGIEDDLVQYLKSKEKFNLFTFRINKKKQNILHVCSELSVKELVLYILKSGMCDLSSKDIDGKVAYSLANKKTKQVYRNFRRDQPDAYNYEGSLIPNPDGETPSALISSTKSKNAKARERRMNKINEEEKNATPAHDTTKHSCVHCRTDLGNNIPYTFKTSKFCSLKCVKEYKANTITSTTSNEREISPLSVPAADVSQSSRSADQGNVNNSDWKNKLTEFRKLKKAEKEKEAELRALTPQQLEERKREEQRRLEREQRAEAAERRIRLLMQTGGGS